MKPPRIPEFKLTGVAKTFTAADRAAAKMAARAISEQLMDASATFVVVLACFKGSVWNSVRANDSLPPSEVSRALRKLADTIDKSDSEGRLSPDGEFVQ